MTSNKAVFIRQTDAREGETRLCAVSLIRDMKKILGLESAIIALSRRIIIIIIMKQRHTFHSLVEKKKPTLSASYQNEAVNKIKMNENIRFSVFSLKQA